MTRIFLGIKFTTHVQFFQIMPLAKFTLGGIGQGDEAVACQNEVAVRTHEAIGHQGCIL